MVSLAVRGAWIESMVAMHDTAPPGVLECPVTHLAALWRCSIPEACHIVTELHDRDISTVRYSSQEGRQIIVRLAWSRNHTTADFSADFQDISAAHSSNVILICRRMFRDWFRKETDRLRKAGGEIPDRFREMYGWISSQNPPEFRSLLSYSPSTTTPSRPGTPSCNDLPVDNTQCRTQGTSDGSDGTPKKKGKAVTYILTYRKRKLSGKRLDTFLEFWHAFDYKDGRARAADAWMDIPSLTDAMVQDICAAARAEARRRPGLVQAGKTPPMAQGWISGRRWEDESLQAEARAADRAEARRRKEEEAREAERAEMEKITDEDRQKILADLDAFRKKGCRLEDDSKEEGDTQ
jgi:hypothetical protein